MDSSGGSDARRRASAGLRNALLLSYLALGVWIAFATCRALGRSQDLLTFVVIGAAGVALAVVVLAYFLSLLTLGLLYRTRLSMRVVALLAFLAGPVLLAGLFAWFV
ncbi:MAG: hypothetical protein KJZ54_14700 [Phycisphaerales bacterium]|nr:hypothetical protein [Phycisphaerales bacterium]